LVYKGEKNENQKALSFDNTQESNLHKSFSRTSF